MILNDTIAFHRFYALGDTLIKNAFIVIIIGINRSQGIRKVSMNEFNMFLKGEIMINVYT